MAMKTARAIRIEADGEADGEAEAKAVAGALRHWRKFHADHGEEDTREAAAEIGPSAYGGPDRRSLEWWKKEGTE